ncbi:hypothetical protein M501DRAFT_1009311 [Patellaria atrata CBS 101060]|uniref:Uncharacterized protein n=1 Tax=Patellaria atrata CBS 101060 TaxID=1346257 RepID=A0A9P4SGI0_9PEZI|nr:hypothetical protein M501DRAFT_1009311 [Patellaria atrata CBS 101060]
MINFPEFIAGIVRNPKGDIYQDTDFYPEEEAKQKMKEIGAWLKSIESKSFEKVPLEAEQLDSDVVKKIENSADLYIQQGPAVKAQKMSGVPRTALLKPSDAEHRLNGQHFSLGDRIVYVQDRGRVPIGQRGTVIGMTRTPRMMMLDVVFDTTFMGGTTLTERCSPFRGSTVPINAVLNLTDKQVVYLSQAAAARQPQQQVQPLVIQGNYSAPRGGYGNLQPAAAPPPLRGSFRGAVSGQQNGMGRGRGRAGFPNGANGHQPQQQLPIHNGPPTQPANNGRGRAGFAPRGGNPSPNHQGYTVVDDVDPDAGILRHNPNFKPRSYQNVPPPAIYDVTNRGRGHGRGRGRGDRGGGRGRGSTVTANRYNS